MIRAILATAFAGLRLGCNSVSVTENPNRYCVTRQYQSYVCVFSGYPFAITSDLMRNFCTNFAKYSTLPYLASISPQKLGYRQLTGQKFEIYKVGEHAHLLSADMSRQVDGEDSKCVCRHPLPFFVVLEKQLKILQRDVFPAGLKSIRQQVRGIHASQTKQSHC
jgi:hypothetical protein